MKLSVFLFYIFKYLILDTNFFGRSTQWCILHSLLCTHHFRTFTSIYRCTHPLMLFNNHFDHFSLRENDWSHQKKIHENVKNGSNSSISVHCICKKRTTWKVLGVREFQLLPSKITYEHFIFVSSVHISPTTREEYKQQISFLRILSVLCAYRTCSVQHMNHFTEIYLMYFFSSGINIRITNSVCIKLNI